MVPLEEQQIKANYIKWLFALISEGDYNGSAKEHAFVLQQMFSREFYWVHPNDENRASDGKALRERYSDVYNGQYSSENVLEALDGPCSVLEMMIALASRMKDCAIFDVDDCCHTSECFWIMMDHLGLIDQTNKRWDPEWCDRIIDIFLDRKYSRFGYGSLFIWKPHNDKDETDFRGMEIWYQMQRYCIDFL